MPVFPRRNYVQVCLRISPELRASLVEKARAQGLTFNGFVTGLISSVREQSKLLKAEKTLNEAVAALKVFVHDPQDLMVSEDYRRVASKLTSLAKDLVERRMITGREREAIIDTIDEFAVRERNLEACRAGAPTPEVGYPKANRHQPDFDT
jgi:hypothetical protein